MVSWKWRPWLCVFVASGLAGCGSNPEPSLPEEPVDWSLTAEVDKHQVQVGEEFVLTVMVRHPAGERFIAPYAEEVKPFELVERTEEEVSPVEDIVRYRLAAYRLPETLTLPALDIQYRDASEELVSLSTPDFEIEVVTSLTSDVTDIHDIKGPVDLETPPRWSMLWWLLLALVLALIAYLLYRRFARKDQELPRVYVPPPPPADQEALAALERLAQSSLLEAGEARRYHDQLAEIVKRYAGRRFRVPYLEQTTHEILGSLRPKKVAALSQFRELLQVADLVKFAKLDPGAEEGRRLLSQAREFVELTRVRESASPDVRRRDPA